MSTIPEVTKCHELGMAILGMSLITNVAAAHGGGHDEVVQAARRGSKQLQELILAVADAIRGDT